MVDAVLARLRQLHPRLIDLALDRIQRLLEALDHPDQRLPPVIHVAGTNGKGSTVAFLRAIGEAAGLRVHVYTSPHLVRFVERIRLAGTLISEDAVTALLEECERANGGLPITEFEIITVAGLLAFARTPADLCLLEVGLGGRWDATNVVDKPVVTVIAPVSYDHQAFLGNTLTEIASEKAGIIKPGVPCVSARQEPEALAVIEAEAARAGAPLHLEGRDWSCEPTEAGMRFIMDTTILDLPAPSLPGPHQIDNAGLAVAASLIANPLLKPSAIARGVAHAQWPARLQRLDQGRLAKLLPADRELWLDGAHNPHGAHALASMADQWRDRPLDLVIGMLKTHDAAAFLTELKGLTRSLRTVAIPDAPQSRTAEEMAEIAAGLGFHAEAAPEIETALSALASGAGPARVLICGSLYLAGAVLAENGTEVR